MTKNAYQIIMNKENEKNKKKTDFSHKTSKAHAKLIIYISHILY